jgi:hypothetical protein
MLRLIILVTLISLLPPAVADSCSHETYDLGFVQSRDFYAEGPSPFIEQETGSVTIVDQEEVAPGVTRITLQCNSLFGCTGEVHGC